MSAAQLEARRKAGLSTSNPTHACSGAISNAKPDCEEKRDPDKRSLIIQNKENELDPDTQLEKRSFAAQRTDGSYTQKAYFAKSRERPKADIHAACGESPVRAQTYLCCFVHE